jgi:hypothetical protein
VAGTGAAGADGGAAGADGGTCTPNTLTPTAPAVPETRVAEAFSMAAAAGGTIADGTYWLSTLSLYTGPGGATGSTGTNRSQTLRVAGNTIEIVIVSTGQSTPRHITFTRATNGSTLTLTGVCPTGVMPVLAYTATATELTLYSPSNGSNLAEIQVFKLANAACVNTFPSTAPAIMGTSVAEALPVANATGGTLVPGTYHQTGLTVYTGTGGATGPFGNPRSQTLRVTAAGAGFTIELAAASAPGSVLQWQVFSAAPASNALNVMPVCPAPGAVVPGILYSANATTWQIYNPTNKTLEAYVKQP